jgi:protein O-mannosyl-transferase
MSDAPSAQPAATAARNPLLFAVAVVALTLLTYWPAIRADFIWNDADYVTAPALQSVDGLRRIWTEVGATEQYYPLLHSAFWVEHRLWGDSPAGYHLFNLLLHAGAACLFALVLRQLAVPGARLAALVFALHPVGVESVAWISEQKNTLSLVFFLGAALAYLKFEDAPDREARRARGRYRWGTVLFVCALLSKTTTATLPAALLVITWWRRGRIEWRRDVVPLLPWFAVGAALGLFSAWVEKHVIGAAGAEFALSFTERGLLAGRIIWFYLGKLLLPIDLIFIYPRWIVDAGVPWQWLFPLALVALLAGLWLLRRRTRAPLAVLLLFAGSLFPVLGFFNVYGFMFSFVADHWQYLPCLAVVAFAGAGLARLPTAASGLLIAALGVLTWQQSHMYADMDTFYRTTLARNPDCWMAENNLGSLRHLAGRDDEAIAHYLVALRLKPDSSKAHTNLGNILRDQHRLAEALPHFEAAVQIEPDASVYQDNLAGALRESGRAREALPHHREALRLDPTYSAAHNNYGVTLRELGRADEAITEFEQAVRFDPNSAPAHLNLMLSFWQAGHVAEAEAEYREARRLNPAIPEVDFSIGAPK